VNKRLFKHPWIIIMLAVIMTLGFATQLNKLQIENSLRIYLPVENEAFVRLEEMEDIFGGTEAIGVVLDARQGGILTASNIRLIQEITRAIEDIEDIEGVVSLTNIEYITAEEGSLVAGTLVADDFAGTPDELDDIRQRLISWDEMYHRVVMSDDWKSSQMSITLNTGLSSKAKQGVLDQVREIVTTMCTDPNIQATIVGDPVVSESAGQFMRSDLTRLIPLVILVVVLSLLLSFGTIEGTLLPLATVLMSSIWSLGLMGMFGITFTIVSSVIPVALIAIGSAYGIHVINHYTATLSQAEGTITTDRHREIVIAGVSDVLPAVILAAITTIAGFLSLVGSPLVPLRSFSVFTALGILFSLLLSITFIPAVLMVKSESRIGKPARLLDALRRVFLGKKSDSKAVARPAGGNGGERRPTLYRLYQFLASNPLRLIIFSIIIIAVSLMGIRYIVVDTALINYFPPQSTLRKDIDFVDERFAGTNQMHLIIEGPEKGAMTNPEILKQMDGLQTHLQERYDEIGKVVSFTTFVKRMNQVMHIPEDPSFYASLTDELFYEDDLGFSSFDSMSFFDDEPAVVDDGYVDPNIAYSQRLAETMTLADGFDLLSRAYASCGGSKATVEEMVRYLEREFNYRGASYHEIPYDPAKYPAATTEELQDLVTQYLLLFSGSLDSFIDDPLMPRTARVAIQLKTRSTTVISNIIDEAEAYAALYFPEGYTIHATGNGQLESVMTQLILSSQMQSLLFSLASVFIILLLYFKSPLAGVVGIMPLFFSILLNYMAMGIFNIHLDLFTSLIASIAVGVGIDYTIHFMTNYRKERQKSSDLEEVTIRTMQKSGKGIFINALSVGLGFMVLIFSRFVVLRYIGILAAWVMFTSSVLAMTIIPGLLNIFDFKFMSNKDRRGRR